MATKRTDFAITQTGSLMCNQFYEKSSTYTSSNELPFYPSTDYYACADSLNESADNTTIKYDKSSKVLNLNMIIEGDISDYTGGGYYNTQQYVTGSATSISELLANFDPVLYVPDDNINNLSSATASNFETFKSEVKRLGGDNSVCKICLVQKHKTTRIVKAKHNSDSSYNADMLSYSGIVPPSSSGTYVVRVGYASDTDYAGAIGHFTTANIGSTFMSIVKSIPSCTKTAADGRKYLYYSIVYDYPSSSGTTALSHITKVAGNWIAIKEDGNGITPDSITNIPIYNYH